MTRKRTLNARTIRLNISDDWARFGSTKLAAAVIRGALTMVVLSALLLIAARAAQAQRETVLYNFTGGSDGFHPQSSLIADGAGNLYGTTALGGTCPGWNQYGCGVVFEISPNGSGGWKQTVLHTFAAPPDGANPLFSPVIFDKSGNLYGTTQWGGDFNFGTVFELSPVGASWTATILYSFTGGADGGHPAGGLVMDRAGNLYGTGQTGGANGQGTVFMVPPSGAETLLYTFGSQSGDGSYPFAGLVLDETGNLYSTTVSGGAKGGGTVFKLSPSGAETVLYSFGSQSGDGSNPFGGFLIFDNNGNLYGTTVGGGTHGDGTVFKLSPSGAETVLHSFGSQSGDGSQPWSGLVFDEKGNLYGTTHFGGRYSAGAVFEVTSATAATSTGLTSSLNPSIYGQAVTWTATVTTSGPAAPTGRVKFTWNGYSIGTATLNVSGVATLTKSNLNADPYPLTAVYAGDAANLGSTSAVLNQVVQPTTSTATLTSSPNPSAQGQSVTFTAKISSPTVSPTGPVTFTVGKTVLGTAQLSGGKAKLATSSLLAGATKVTVTYYGDSNIVKSSASVTQTVDQ